MHKPPTEWEDCCSQDVEEVPVFYRLQASNTLHPNDNRKRHDYAAHVFHEINNAEQFSLQLTSVLMPPVANCTPYL
jgi:hypothetical protein